MVMLFETALEPYINFRDQISLTYLTKIQRQLISRAAIMAASSV